MNKEINLSSGNYIFLKIPDSAYDFEMRRNNQVVYLLKGVINPLTGSEKSDIIEIPNVKFGIQIKDLKIIATTKDITEEQCNNLVLCVDIKSHKLFGNGDFKNYNSEFPYYFKTTKESLQSLLQVNNLTASNYLILKKL